MSGWEMVEFDPLAFRARVAPVSTDELRARSALSNALGCKPWEVQVKAVSKDRSDRLGYDVVLPKTYVPSKHNAKIEEAVTCVFGRPGWFFEVAWADDGLVTMKVRPGKLPTFQDHPLSRGVWGDALPAQQHLVVEGADRPAPAEPGGERPR